MNEKTKMPETGDGEVGIHRRGQTYYLTFKKKDAKGTGFTAVVMNAEQWVEMIFSLMEAMSIEDIPLFAGRLSIKCVELDAKNRAEDTKEPEAKA